MGEVLPVGSSSQLIFATVLEVPGQARKNDLTKTKESSLDCLQDYTVSRIGYCVCLFYTTD